MKNNTLKDKKTNNALSKTKKSEPLKKNNHPIEEIEKIIDNLHNKKKAKKEQKHNKKNKQKKTFKPKRLIASLTLIVFILLLFLYVIFPTMQGSMHFLTVLSGSMTPGINPGDIVVSTEINPEEIKINDIITFAYLENPNKCITHRVVNITNENSIIEFQTQGDANEEPDQKIVQSEELIGKVEVVIPYLGYLPYYAKSPIGFITLILIPGILIIVSESWKIAKIKMGLPEKKKVKRRIRFTTKIKSKEK